MRMKKVRKKREVRNGKEEARKGEEAEAERRVSMMD